jgi:hypothetical protein
MAAQEAHKSIKKSMIENNLDIRIGLSYNKA